MAKVTIHCADLPKVKRLVETHRALLRESLRLLEAMEWGDNPEDDDTALCPLCGVVKYPKHREHHKRDCPAEAHRVALRKALGEEKT